MAGESDFQMPDLSELPEDDKVDVCWDWILRTYPEQVGDAVINFFDIAWAADNNPEAWSVATKLKERARREGYLR